MGEFKLAHRVLPTRKHDRIMVWLVSIGTVLLTFGILFFIAYDPHSLAHRVGPRLIWVLVLLVLCDLATVLVALRRNFQRVWQELTFELNEDELNCKRPGHPDVRISLSQVKSLYEQSGCLVVAGGDPPQRVAVPKKVENFNLLQAELLNHASWAPPPRRIRLRWVTSLLTIVCWLLLIWSGNINIARVAGGGVLVLLGEWSFELRHRLLHSPKRTALWALVGSSWLLAGCAIYIKVFGGRL